MSLRPKIGELLVAAEVIAQDVLDQALAKQASGGGRIGKILVAMGAIDEEMLVRTVARQLDLPVVRLRGKQVKPDVLKRLPGHIARTHRCIPVLLDERNGETLLIAMEDPSDGVALDQIAIAAELPVKVVLTGPTELDEALLRYYPEGADDAAPGAEAGEEDGEEEVLLLEDAVVPAPEPAPPPPAPAAPPDPPAQTSRREPDSLFDGADDDLGDAPPLDTGGAAWEARVDQLDISGKDLDPLGDIDEGPDPSDSFVVDPNDLSGRDGGVDLLAADSLDEAIEEVRSTAPEPHAAKEAQDDGDASGARTGVDHLPRDAELRALAELLIERGLITPADLARKLRAARSGGAD